MLNAIPCPVLCFSVDSSGCVFSWPFRFAIWPEPRPFLPWWMPQTGAAMWASGRTRSMHSRSTQAGRGAEWRNGIAILDTFGTTLHCHDPVMRSPTAAYRGLHLRCRVFVSVSSFAHPDRGAVAAVPNLGPRCLVDVSVGILLACWSGWKNFDTCLLRLVLLFHLWLESHRLFVPPVGARPAIVNL